MKYPESYINLIIIIGSFVMLPFLNISGASLWWGFSYIPFLPILLLVAFFLLPQSQYLYTVILAGWWYDIMVGSIGPTALVAVILSSIVLYAMAQVISSRSLLSDILIACMLYLIWILTIFIIGAIAGKISPSSPVVVMSYASIVIGLVGTLILQIFSRRYILKDNVVPKAIV